MTQGVGGITIEPFAGNEWSGGNGYRSSLEARCAEALRTIGLVAEYERKTEFSVHYLPDFTVTGQMESEEAAVAYAVKMEAYEEAGGLGRSFQWIEVKPPDFLYRLRDDLGVTRRAGEYFKGAVTVKCTADDFRARADAEAFRELWKPKKLAEKSGRNVLVVGNAHGTSSLTILMTPDAAIFERNHPVANWKHWTIDAERRERRAREEEQRRLELERFKAEKQREHERMISAIRAELPRIPLLVNRYTNRCVFCNELVPAETGNAFMFDGWKSAHKACVARGQKKGR